MTEKIKELKRDNADLRRKISVLEDNKTSLSCVILLCMLGYFLLALILVIAVI